MEPRSGQPLFVIRTGFWSRAGSQDSRTNCTPSFRRFSIYAARMSSDLHRRVERIAQAVANEIKAEHRQGNHRGREQAHVQIDADISNTFADHLAPTRN